MSSNPARCYEWWVDTKHTIAIRLVTLCTLVAVNLSAAVKKSNLNGLRRPGIRIKVGRVSIPTVTARVLNEIHTAPKTEGGKDKH